MFKKVVQITNRETISPFSAISGPLRAMNIIGALPLRFHEDLSGKMKVTYLHIRQILIPTSSPQVEVAVAITMHLFP